MTKGLGLKLLAASTALALLAGCDRPLDFDLRGKLGSAADTSDAARNATAARPSPDNRGIISYPNYQVAVAERGDTLASLAARIGADPAELARYNGIQTGDSLRVGEIIALPNRVSEPSPATGAAATGPIQPPEVDITELAEGAIARAQPAPATQPATQPATAAPPAAEAVTAQRGIEPIRHKVVRGETAYTVARLYNTSVRALAEWNGLDSSFSIREGQFLLIPTPLAEAPAALTAAATQTEEVPKPGAGSPTPVPPSAVTPLPKDESRSASAAAEPAATPDLGKTQTAAASQGKFAYPVRGKIIRDYAKGKNEGIDIAAPSGTPIGAAEAGTVAAITSDADQVPIIVVKHPDNLLTVYANVGNIAVKKGDSVSRGQKLATVRAGESAYLHFEVRKGFESVDPLPYLQ
jgi:murein DD-endopeptidase MepM/ murein hydrolase activator NlpD